MLDWQVVTHIVNTMKLGSTLVDVVEDPDFLKLMKSLQKLSRLERIETTSEDEDVLAAFVQNYTTPHDVRLACHVRNWVIFMDDHIKFYELNPSIPSMALSFVRITQSHRHFLSNFKFKSKMEGWQHVTPDYPLCSCVRLISIDCEMVHCGPILGRCIARLCVVGSNLEPLIDEFVIPVGPVVNYCTSIHGIMEQHLQAATLTQKEAQARVMELLKCPGTIVVGHAVFHDLKALKIDCKQVIDTAFLFKDHRTTPKQIYGLAELCERFLGYKLREAGKIHDCMKDAIAPMQLVLEALRVLYAGACATGLLKKSQTSCEVGAQCATCTTCESM